MLLWFVTLGVLGAWRIILEPSVLQALNPKWAWDFIADAPWETFLLLGAIVLALTGAETLYADMGHFGRKAIRRAWFGLVLPGLVLCYFGHGALLLADPTALKTPFFLLAPVWARPPRAALGPWSTFLSSPSGI